MASDSPEKNKREDDARSREDKKKDDNEAIQPAQEKTPEGHGNLKRRADWFQKRSGQTP